MFETKSVRILITVDSVLKIGCSSAHVTLTLSHKRFKLISGSRNVWCLWKWHRPTRIIVRRRADREGARRKRRQCNHKHNFSLSLLYPTVPCSQFTNPSNYCVVVGRDSSVGIATRYALDGPGIESRWGPDFPHPSGPALEPTHPTTSWVPGISGGGGKGVEEWRWSITRI